jgi:hypothetical protein
VVFACECPKRNDFQREFEQSQSVFVGEVVEINNSLTDTLITFNVERIWKGTKSERIVVRTRNRGKTCGYNFKEGERYLVYADEELRTSTCSRTREFKSNDPDLIDLAKKEEL